MRLAPFALSALLLPLNGCMLQWSDWKSVEGTRHIESTEVFDKSHDVDLTTVHLRVHQTGPFAVLRAEPLCEAYQTVHYRERQRRKREETSPSPTLLTMMGVGGLGWGLLLLITDEDHRDKTDTAFLITGLAVGGVSLLVGGPQLLATAFDETKTVEGSFDEDLREKRPCKDKGFLSQHPLQFHYGSSMSSASKFAGSWPRFNDEGELILDLNDPSFEPALEAPMAKLFVSLHPRGNYSEIDLEDARKSFLAKRMETLLSSCREPKSTSDCEEMERFIETYPASEAAQEGRRMLAQQAPLLRQLKMGEDLERLDLKACSQSSTENTSILQSECSPLADFLENYPEAPEVKNIEAHLKKGQARVKMLEQREARAAAEAAKYANCMNIGEQQLLCCPSRDYACPGRKARSAPWASRYAILEACNCTIRQAPRHWNH